MALACLVAHRNQLGRHLVGMGQCQLGRLGAPMESMELGSMALVAALERKEESLAFQGSLVGKQGEKLASLEDRSLVGPPLVE